MSDGLVLGVFDDQDHAGQAIEALTNRKFETKSIAVRGDDSDEFRNITAPLASESADKIVILGTVIGIFIGTLAGFAAMFTQAAFPYFLAVGPLYSAVAGAAAGGMVGFLLGAVVHFDTVDYKVSVSRTQMHDKRVHVSVNVKNKSELADAEAIMQERGAVEVHAKLAPSPIDTDTSETEKIEELAK